MLALCTSLHHSCHAQLIHFQLSTRSMKTEFQVPLSKQSYSGHLPISLHRPSECNSHREHTDYTLCGRDSYTLGKGGCWTTRHLRERCCLPSDQSSEHLTNSSGVFQSRSTQLIYIKKKKKEKKEHSVKPDPK